MVPDTPQDPARLEFQCLCCGNCCRGDGYVRITVQDIDRMATALGVMREAFIAQYTRTPEIKSHIRRGEYWLTNHLHAPLDCIFLVDNRCILHEAKPEQCLNFPALWNHDEMLDECAGYQLLKQKLQAPPTE